MNVCVCSLPSQSDGARIHKDLKLYLAAVRGELELFCVWCTHIYIYSTSI